MIVSTQNGCGFLGRAAETRKWKKHMVKTTRCFRGDTNKRQRIENHGEAVPEELLGRKQLDVSHDVPRRQQPDTCKALKAPPPHSLSLFIAESGPSELLQCSLDEAKHSKTEVAVLACVGDLTSETMRGVGVCDRCGVETGLFVALSRRVRYDLGSLFSSPTFSPACLLVVTIIKSVKHT